MNVVLYFPFFLFVDDGNFVFIVGVFEKGAPWSSD